MYSVIDQVLLYFLSYHQLSGLPDPFINVKAITSNIICGCVLCILSNFRASSSSLHSIKTDLNQIDHGDGERWIAGQIECEWVLYDWPRTIQIREGRVQFCPYKVSLPSRNKRVIWPGYQVWTGGEILGLAAAQSVRSTRLVTDPIFGKYSSTRG